MAFSIQGLKRFLRGPKSITPMTLIWFALLALCVLGIYQFFGFLPKEWKWINDGHPIWARRRSSDLRTTISLILGLISSLYLVGRIFEWAKTDKRPGNTPVAKVDCCHCGAECEVDYSTPPAGYQSGCLAILLVPTLSALALLPIGRLLERTTGIDLIQYSGYVLLPIWFLLIMIGFGIVRLLRLAALDQFSLESNPEWKNYSKDEESRDHTAICPRCGKNPFNR